MEDKHRNGMEDKIQFKAYVTRRTVKGFKQFLSRKWQTYSRGIISLEVEQALKQYMSSGKTEHTHTSEPQNSIPMIHRGNGNKVLKITKPVKLSKEKADTVRLALEHAKVILDRASKGLKMEANEKERIKAAMLKEEIAEWLVESGKYEDRQLIKFIPKTLLQQALTSIQNITDNRSINNQIAYLRTYKQIDQVGPGQYQLIS